MGFEFITDPLERIAQAAGVGSGPEPAHVWKYLTDGSFKGYTFHVAVPDLKRMHGAANIEVATERRLQKIHRPMRDGARVQDFGQSARSFSAEIVFFGPNYQYEIQEFKKVISDGLPGVLTLPDQPQSVIAFFEKMTESSSYSGGNSKTFRVSWVEHTEEATDLPSGTGQRTLGSAGVIKSQIIEQVDTSLSLLQSNPFLTAIRTFDATLSAARSLSNAVTTLDAGVRNRINQLQTDMTETLSAVKGALSVIDSLGSGKKSAPVSSNATDAETGERIVDFSSHATSPSSGSSVVPQSSLNPTPKPAVSYDTSAIVSNSKAEQFVSGAVKDLKSQTSGMMTGSSGRTNDVDGSVRTLVLLLGDYVKALKLTSETYVQVPYTMSLMEVLFLNNVDLSKLSEVLSKNTFIDDPLVVAAGSVVKL